MCIPNAVNTNLRVAILPPPIFKELTMSKWDFINRLESIDGGFDKYRLKESDVTPEFIVKANQLYATLNIEPRKSPAFEDALGLTGSEVRKLIRWLRLNGRPVTSSPGSRTVA